MFNSEKKTSVKVLLFGRKFLTSLFNELTYSLLRLDMNFTRIHRQQKHFQRHKLWLNDKIVSNIVYNCLFNNYINRSFNFEVCLNTGNHNKCSLWRVTVNNVLYIFCEISEYVITNITYFQLNSVLSFVGN